MTLSVRIRRHVFLIRALIALENEMRFLLWILSFLLTVCTVFGLSSRDDEDFLNKLVYDTDTPCVLKKNYVDCDFYQFCEPRYQRCFRLGTEPKGIPKNLEELRAKFSLNISCTTNEQCGLGVCVLEETGSTCYVNSMDFCYWNKNCEEKNNQKESYYCNVHVGGRRRFYCEKISDAKALIDKDSPGLTLCTVRKNCPNNYYCEIRNDEISKMKAILPSNSGYCAKDTCKSNKECGNGKYCNDYNTEHAPRECKQAKDSLAAIRLPDEVGFGSCKQNSDCTQYNKKDTTYKCKKDNSLMSIKFSTGEGYCAVDLCNLTHFYGKHIQKCGKNRKCELNATCVTHDKGGDYCCPQAEISNGIMEPTIPYMTNKKCDSAARCEIGAFCDPVKLMCIFHVGQSKRKALALKSLDSKPCTKNFNCAPGVCVRETKSSYACYRNPLNSCHFNKDCSDGQFCNVHNYLDSRHHCEKASADAWIDSEFSGLKICKDTKSCGSEAYHCKKGFDGMTVNETRNYGFCAKSICNLTFYYGDHIQNCDAGSKCSLKAKCVSYPGMGDFCCPGTHSSKGILEPVELYLTNITCDKTNWQTKCKIGAFCDPISNTCMFHMGPSKRNDYALAKAKTCATNDNCPYAVCVREKEKTNACYKNPLDECTSNKECTKKDEFCNVHDGKARYSCVKAPSDAKAVIDKQKTGLVPCKDMTKCNKGNSTHYFCQRVGTSTNLPKNFGYCASHDCYSNEDCQTGSFCNSHVQMDVKRQCQKVSDPLAVIETKVLGLLLCKNKDDCNDMQYYCKLDTSAINVKLANGQGFCATDICNLTLYYGDHIQKCDAGSKCSLNAKCISYPGVGAFCCPETDIWNNKMEPIAPYFTDITCDKTNWLTKCKIGAFCDPINNTCVFHVGESKRKDYALDKATTCTTNDNCKFSVCVRGTSSSMCYRNPLDQCSLNKHCGYGEFCNVHVDEKKRYLCEKVIEPVPVPLIESEQSGLQFCQSRKDCNYNHCERTTKLVNVTIPNSYSGYCAHDKCVLNEDCGIAEFCNAYFEEERHVCEEVTHLNAVINKEESGLVRCQERKDCQDSQQYCEKNIGSMKLPSGFGFCASDECYLNKDCDEGDFCNVHVEENKRHVCETPMHSKSIIEKDRSGLIICYTKRHCKHYQQNSVECMGKELTPNLLISTNMTGHCAFRIVFQCRGIPRIVYTNETNYNTCEKNSDCSSSEFCDLSATSDSVLYPIPPNRGLCCSLPNCGGEAVKNEDSGIKMCYPQSADASQCSGSDEYCVGNFTRGKKSLWFPDEGVCCKFPCAQKPKAEASLENTVYATDICDPDTISDCASSKDTVAVCEKFPSETPQSRCCKYKRIVSQCASPYSTEIRNSQGNVVACEYSYQCRNDDNSQCGVPESPIPGIKKMCCDAKVCPDHFTDMKDSEGTCENHEQCGEKGLKGMCHRGHCCPIVVNYQEIAHDITTVTEVDYPFKTTTPCTTVADCEGELRFCDVATNRCTYYGPSATAAEKKKSKSCAVEDVSCGEMDGDRTVCMVDGFPDERENIPYCYKHPLDNCKKNQECKEDEYCGVALDVPLNATSLANRMCRKIPKGAALNGSGAGLKECTADEDCGDLLPPLICHLNETAGQRSYCRTVPLLVCHGKPLAKYVGRKQATCKKNIDCGENAFCDMDIERSEGFSKDEGVCCSVPEKCGGKAVKGKEVGLSFCMTDKQCSLDNGEICSKSFSKEPGSRWMAEDGVCCKMICPNSTNIEAEKKTVLAGPRCGNETDEACAINALYIRSCASAPEANYKRCCTYEKRKSLCPADVGEPQREHGLVKECKDQNQKCRGKGVCREGICCEPDTCADFQTLKFLEKPCTSSKDSAKECQQPKGFDAQCLGGFCCPQTSGQVLKEAFLSNIKCTSVSDCPYSKMYCHSKHGRCAYKVARTDDDLVLDGECASKTSTDCKGKDGTNGICLYPTEDRNGLPSCSLEAKSDAVTESYVKEEETSTSVIVGLIIGAIILVLLIAGIVGYVIYKKISNRDKKKKLNRLALPTARSASPTKNSPPKKHEKSRVATPSVHSTMGAADSQHKNSQGRAGSIIVSKKTEPKSLAPPLKSNEAQQPARNSNIVSAHSKQQSMVQSRVALHGSNESTTKSDDLMKESREMISKESREMVSKESKEMIAS